MLSPLLSMCITLSNKEATGSVWGIVCITSHLRMEAAIVYPRLEVKKKKEVESLCDCIAFKLSGYITFIVLHITNIQHDYDLHFNSNNTKQLLNPLLEKHWWQQNCVPRKSGGHCIRKIQCPISQWKRSLQILHILWPSTYQASSPWPWI